MKRTLLSILIGLLLILVLGATAVAAGDPPDCINVAAGEGADIDGCISPDSLAPPEVYLNGFLVGKP